MRGTKRKRLGMRSKAIGALASMAGLLVSASVARAGEPRIYGGEFADSCQFPTTVAMVGPNSLCTGTLVHPEIVLYAAHCEAPTHVRFGEEAFAPSFEVQVESCERFIDRIEVGPKDYAYCKLSEPVVSLAPTPVLFGCETELVVAGQAATIAGFGVTEDDESGSKKWAQTEVIGLTQMILVGKDGISAWSGDSGGPVFLQHPLDAGWRAFGIASGGTAPGMPIQYVAMHSAVPWVEEQSGIDITPCHDADGTWNPGPECGGFSTQAEMASPWPDCAEMGSKPSGTCGSPGVEDESPPVVEIVEPGDGTAFDESEALVSVLVEAEDEDAGIRRVSLRLDGMELSEADEVSPYEFEIELGLGSHELVAIAEDLSGVTAESAPVTIEVGTEAQGSTGTGDEPKPGAQGCGCRSDATRPRRGGATAALIGCVLVLCRRRRRCLSPG